MPLRLHPYLTNALANALSIFYKHGRGPMLVDVRPSCYAHAAQRMCLWPALGCLALRAAFARSTYDLESLPGHSARRDLTQVLSGGIYCFGSTEPIHGHTR